ncbi:class I SAM-dependent DNA methyltransferase [Carnobacterium mobile]|uniref:class I SAM-dependent DNA methyltransferase n=1 Tax=Carnobacterium mobile TaxID=2750 RepID=UPI00384F6F74
MGKIHDSLQAINYTGDDLDTLLVRLVFCLFADDTGIFNKGLFRDFLEDNTNEDGADLAPKLQYLFEILDTPSNQRIVDDSIYSEFPYVNGSLFTKRLRTAVFNEEMRSILLECSNIDWGKISPAIFGSMFQSAMDSKKRRQLGAHYTSEENIMKVIKPLFLDELWIEFKRIKSLKRNKLRLLKEFQQNISKLNFFDPACGSGNFLIIAYRELRKLELEVLKAKNYEEYGYESFQMDISLDFNSVIKCDVNQFYGIEIDSFSAQIAQVALWIIDHQMNIEASLYFGASFARLPLGEHATIANGNSLEINWNEVLDARDCNYILGNPPFVGARQMKSNSTQKKDLLRIFSGVNGAGDFDYVTCWYMKATTYIQGSKIEVAFVSTNSICQGIHVGTFWKELIEKKGVYINFAHRSFKWGNEAKGKAAVYCVIVGFAMFSKKNKFIFENDLKNNVSQINGYLINDKNHYLESRTIPISKNIPNITIGNQLLGWDFYSFTLKEKNDFLLQEPEAEPYFHRFIGSRELINDIEKYVLWLGDCPPQILRTLPLTLERVKLVEEKRKESTRLSTRKLAQYPTKYLTERVPESNYLAIPNTSSERRTYIPIGYVDKDWFPSQKIFILFSDDLYYFGILTSYMHMVWMKTVSGRLKIDYSYSKELTYNNFPWPDVTEVAKEKIRKLSNDIISIRSKYSSSSLADLYANPMPPDLLRAHHNLDRAVEKLYRGKQFENDTERLSYLFELYENKTK